MSVDVDDFKIAYQRALDENPTLNIFERKALDFLTLLNQGLAKNYARDPSERETFDEVLRHTLNDKRLKGTERTAYKKLAGYYFSNRASKNKILAAHRQEPKSLPPVGILTDPNGQLRWKL